MYVCVCVCVCVCVFGGGGGGTHIFCPIFARIPASHENLAEQGGGGG